MPGIVPGAGFHAGACGLHEHGSFVAGVFRRPCGNRHETGA